jgi:glutamine phosphoribosylpyrophosphate amidotransferase
MLKHPFLEKPYVANIDSFLGGIEIYDREETLGEELWKYNPNKISDREEIVKNIFLPI